MPVVQETILDPSGRAVADAEITILLIGSEEADGNAAAYGASPTTILGRWRTWTDRSGQWSADLLANDSEVLAPDDSWYLLTRKTKHSVTNEALSVPNGAGPYSVAEVLTVPPTALPTFLSDSVALALATTALPGTGQKVSRADHVHPTTGLATLATINTFTQPQSGKFRDSGGAWLNAKASPWGAVGDDAADDTAAIQAVITAGIVAMTPVYVPQGAYRIYDTIVVAQANGLRIEGAGAATRWNRGTQFIWYGPPDRPMFKVQDCNGCTFAHFSARGYPTLPLLAFCYLENITGSGTTQQRNDWDHVVVDGTDGSNPGVQRGWVTHVGTGLVDGNNDFHAFRDCDVRSAGIGWLFNHAQSKSHYLENCNFQGATAGFVARAAVVAGYDWDYATGLPVSTAAGSYAWVGGGISHCAEAAFITGPSGDIVNIIGANVETSARLLLAGGPSPVSSHGCMTNLAGIRFDNPANELAADGYFVVQNDRGSLSLDSLRIGDSGGHSPKIQQNPVYNGFGSVATLEISNSFIDTASATLVVPNAYARAIVKNVTWRNRNGGGAGVPTYGNFPDGIYGAGLIEQEGANSPEGVLAAPVGSIWHRTNGGASTSLYVKESGAGNTGWRAV